MQVFKITLEYWNFFVPDVYSSVSTLDVNAPFAFGGPVAPSNRKALYAAILSRLRLLMISRMAKPEEVSAHRQPCSLDVQRCCHNRPWNILPL
jgi:exportin-1